MDSSNDLCFINEKVFSLSETEKMGYDGFNISCHIYPRKIYLSMLHFAVDRERIPALFYLLNKRKEELAKHGISIDIDFLKLLLTWKNNYGFN